MPRTRPLDTYPNYQFMQLISRVLETRKEFLVPCTRLQAASMQGEIYAWRRAAERQPAEARALGLVLEGMREFSLRVTDEGLLVLLSSDMQSPKLISSALGLGEAPPPPGQGEAAAALARLRANLAQGDG